MSIYEYDEERHIRQEREDAWEEGERIGLERGRQEGERIGLEKGRKESRLELIRKKLEKGKSVPEIAEALEEEEEAIRRMIAQIQSEAAEK